MDNSTLDYIFSLPKTEKREQFLEITKDQDTNEYMEYYMFGITGSLGSPPFSGKIALDITEFEYLLKAAFCQGVFYQRFKNKKDLEELVK